MKKANFKEVILENNWQLSVHNTINITGFAICTDTGMGIQFFPCRLFRLLKMKSLFLDY